MTIVKKTLLLVLSMLVLIVALLFFYFRFFVLNDYLKLEKQYTVNAVQQSIKILDNKITSMQSNALDWSLWDDTYYFISDGNQDYIDANISDDNFTNLRLNFFTLIGNDKEIKYIGLYDLDNNKPIEVSDDFIAALLNEEKIIHHDNEQSKVSGIVSLDGIPIIIVSVPILKTDNSGPVNGTLIMGKYLDKDMVNIISSSVGFPVNLYNISETDTEEYVKIFENLTANNKSENIEIEYLDNNQLLGYSIIEDIYGKPILLLQISLQREIYQQGIKQTNVFYAITFTAAFLICLVFYFLLRKMVLLRISNLNIQTNEIGKSRDFSRIIAVKGNDEISRLTGSVNFMLQEIRKFEKEIKYLSFHDYLTGIYNRAFFEEELVRLDTERQLPLTIVIGDVNGLKIINDVFGHERGDELLIRIARILKESFRSEDIVARWGGDEFTVILPKLDTEETLKIISRVNGRFKKESTKTLPLSVAFGLSTKTHFSQKTAEVIKTAENNMYGQKISEQKSIQSTIITSIGKALKEKDYETERHIERMKDLGVKLGKDLKLPEETLDDIALLATLHDIGKISIADSIIFKAADLSRKEWKVIKRHPEIGYRIAESSAELAPIAKGILHHHEWWNGKGYPKGLSGEHIPLIARLIAIVDAFDAMTNDRPYRKALTIEEAIAEIKRCSGTQFDPELVKKFIKIIKSTEFKAAESKTTIEHKHRQTESS